MKPSLPRQLLLIPALLMAAYPTGGSAQDRQNSADVRAVESIHPPTLPQLLEGRKSAPGHYYLEGVMEVGSELHLNDDGSFTWFMAYGSVDEYARGRWEYRGPVKAPQIILIADAAPQITAPYKIDDRSEWSQKEEADYISSLNDIAAAAAQRACPYIGSDYASSPRPFDASSPSIEALSAAEAEMVKARTEFEKIAAQADLYQQASPNPEDGSENPFNERAGDAYGKWQSAWEVYKERFWARNRRAPDYVEPRLPAICIAKKHPSPYETGATIKPRTAIRLMLASPRLEQIDPRLGRYSLSDRAMTPTLIYADGRKVHPQLRRGIIVIGDGPAPIKLVLTPAPDSGLSEQMIALPSLSAGVLPISIYLKNDLLPFETMTLNVTTDGLVPVWPGQGERGIYRKAR